MQEVRQGLLRQLEALRSRATLHITLLLPDLAHSGTSHPRALPSQGLVPFQNYRHR
jgi:hypothetical protein